MIIPLVESEVLGYAAVLAASMMWSLNPAIISKYRSYITPLVFTAMRAVIAATFLGPAVLSRGIDLTDMSIYGIAIALVSAIIGPGIGDASYTRAIQLVGGSMAVIVSYTYIFVAEVLAAYTMGENLRLGVVSGSIVAFIGILVATIQNMGNSRISPKGIVYAAMASLSWGAATVMVKLALTYLDTTTLTFIRLVTIAAAFLPLGMTLEGLPRREVVGPLLTAASLTGVLGWGVGMYLFIYSIDTIGVSATVVATALTPVLSQLSTKILARERPGIRNITGAILIATGIALSIF